MEHKGGVYLVQYVVFVQIVNGSKNVTPPEKEPVQNGLCIILYGIADIFQGWGPSYVFLRDGAEALAVNVKKEELNRRFAMDCKTKSRGCISPRHNYSIMQFLFNI
jgi:hypothetical protein